MEPNTFDVITKGLSQFATWATSVTLIVAGLSAVFKPVRNGLSWLLKKVYGERKNAAVEEMKEFEKRINQKFEKVDGKFDAIEKKVDQSRIETIRVKVLGFAAECRRGVQHSKADFEYVITLNSEYEGLLEKAGVENGVFARDYQFILKCYDEALENDSFLG